MAAKKKGIGHSFLRRLMLIINILAVIALLCAYAASYISPAHYWFFAFCGLAYPYILLLNLFFVLLWLLFWKRFIWLSIVVILMGYNQLLSMVQYRGTNSQDYPQGAMKILSYNVHSLYEIQKTEKKGLMLSKVTDFLIQQKPDILCIQEFYLRSEDSLKVLQKFRDGMNASHYFLKNYRDMSGRKRIFALATFSRYPIAGVGTLRLKDRNTFATYTDLIIGNETVRVYNIHLESIRFGKDDYSFYAQLTDQSKEQDDNFSLKSGSFKIFSKLKKAFVVRSKQVDMLKQDIAHSPYPVIICGDFNDTPASYTYHEMTRGMHDSFQKAGSGIFGSTYKGNFPSFRIDYILYDDSFAAFNYSKINIDLSDHYPVQVFLKKTKKD